MDRLKEKQDIADLLDVYGELLTERQRNLLDLYYNEDFSYGEIAESESISRQAVHDAIQHGKKYLLHFEQHLNLVKQKAAVNEASPAVTHENSVENEAVRQFLFDLYRFLQREDIIYDTQPIKNKLKDLLKKMGLDEVVSP